VGQPTAVIAEGALTLLRPGRVEEVLTPIGLTMHGASVLMFDYISAQLRRGAGRRAADRAVSRVVAQTDEPARWGTEDPLPVLYRAGFRHIRTITFDQAWLSLLGTYDPQKAVRFRAFAVATGALSG
jgi:O-methyltransferase involved in polyketide biosynthesis